MKRKPRLIVIPPQHLGHELHVSRSIVCDMYKGGYISPALGDVIMTGLSDRKFFYEGFFDASRVMDFSQLPGLKHPIRQPKTLDEYLNLGSDFFLKFQVFEDFQIINLKDYAAPQTYCTLTTSDEMRAINYDVPSHYYDEKFIQISKNFNFVKNEEVEKFIPNSSQLYIVIHHRYGSSIEKLLKICAKFSDEVLKIIFTSNAAELSLQLNGVQNISVIDNLRTYATLLRDERCKLLISEWSGGGQISQYTLGPQGVVWYYYDHYPDIFNFTMTHRIWELNATLGTYFNCWDFKCPSGCRIQHFNNLESLISWSI